MQLRSKNLPENENYLDDIGNTDGDAIDVTDTDEIYVTDTDDNIIFRGNVNEHNSWLNTNYHSFRRGTILNVYIFNDVKLEFYRVTKR